jgi:hypothetical protein
MQQHDEISLPITVQCVVRQQSNPVTTFENNVLACPHNCGRALTYIGTARPYAGENRL